MSDTSPGNNPSRRLFIAAGSAAPSLARCPLPSRRAMIPSSRPSPSNAAVRRYPTKHSPSVPHKR